MHFAMTGNADDVTFRLREVSGTETLEIVNNDDLSVLQSQALAETTAVIIEGSELDDTLRLDLPMDALGSSLSILFQGGLGSDTLIGPVSDATWRITGEDSGRVLSADFSSVENLTGAADNEDTFIFEAAGSISGIVEGGDRGLDRIILEDGNCSTLTFTASGPNSGTISRDEDVITYAGFEPIIANSGTAEEIVFNLPGGYDQAEFRWAGDISNPDDFILDSLNGTFEDTTITIGSAVTRVSINLGEGNDDLSLRNLTFLSGQTLELDILGADGVDVVTLDTITLMDIPVLIDGGAGDDVVTVTGTVQSNADFIVSAESFDSEGSTIVAKSIDISALGEVTPGGDIRLGDIGATDRVSLKTNSVRELAAQNIEVQAGFLFVQAGTVTFENIAVTDTADIHAFGGVRFLGTVFSSGALTVTASGDIEVHNDVIGEGGINFEAGSEGAIAIEGYLTSFGTDIVLRAGGAITSTPVGSIFSSVAPTNSGKAGNISVLNLGDGGISLEGLIVANGGDSGGDGGLITIFSTQGEVAFGGIENKGGAGASDGAVQLSSLKGIRQFKASENTALDARPLGFAEEESTHIGELIAAAPPSSILGSAVPITIRFIVKLGFAPPRQVRVLTTPEDDGGSGLTLAGLIEDLNRAFAESHVQVQASAGGAVGDRVRLAATGSSALLRLQAVNTGIRGGELKIISSANVELAGGANDVDTLAAKVLAGARLVYEDANDLSVGTILELGSGLATMEEVAGVMSYGVGGSYGIVSLASTTGNLSVDSNIAAEGYGKICIKAFEADRLILVNATVQSDLGDINLQAGGFVLVNTSGSVTTKWPGDVSITELVTPVRTECEMMPRWISQGPGPLTGGQVTGIPDQPVAGAVQGIAVAPHDLNSLYIATVGGGVWRNSSRTLLFDSAAYQVNATSFVKDESGEKLYDHKDILDPFVVFLKENPSLNVKVIGHTDSIGDQSDNLTLSANRAQAVYNYLQANGIAAARMTLDFWGESSSIVRNIPGADGTLLNRRVDLIVDHWEPLTDFLPSLSISSIAVSPRDNEGNLVTPATPPDKLVIFAGTGSVSSSVFSNRADTAIGLLRSIDGGESWEILHRTLLEGSTLNAIALSKDGELWVATDGNTAGGAGLFHSSDYGDSLQPVELVSGLAKVPVTDVAIDPDDPARVYAGVPGQGVFVSENGGQTWSTAGAALTGFESAARIKLAVSRSLDADTGNHPVYAALIGTITDITSVASAGDDFFVVAEGTLLQAGDTVTISDSAHPEIRESHRILSIGLPADGSCRVTLDAPLQNSYGSLTSTVDLSVIGLRLSGVFRSASHGGAWDSMDLPGTYESTGFFGVHVGRQGDLHFSMAADPYDPNVLYIGGDRQPGKGAASGEPDFPNSILASNYTGRLFKGFYDGTSGSTEWLAITDDGVDPDGPGPLVGTAPHADSRALVFQGLNLLEADDGGIYRLSDNVHGLTTAATAAGAVSFQIYEAAELKAGALLMVFDGVNPSEMRVVAAVGPVTAGEQTVTLSAPLQYAHPKETHLFVVGWNSLNHDLSLTEFYDIAYDSANHLILGGTQDIGVALQSAFGSTVWDTLRQGDGAFVETDGSTLYYSSQIFGKFTMAAPAVPAMYPGLQVNGTLGASLFAIENNLPQSTVQFVQPFRLNAITPGNLLVGTNYIYESVDNGETLQLLNALPLQVGGEFQPSQNANLGEVNALVYGGRQPDGAGGVQDRENVIYVGTNPKTSSLMERHALWVRQAGSGLFSPLVPVKSFTAYTKAAVQDIAVDPGDWRRVYVLDVYGRVWFSSDGANDPAAWNWEYLTGNLPTLPGAENLQRIAVVNIDGTSVLLAGGEGGLFRRVGDGDWCEYGVGLPNSMVTSIEYVGGADDVLIVGTLGRGAWILPHAGATLAEPTVLKIEGLETADVFYLERDPAKPWLLNVFQYLNGEVRPAAPGLQIPFTALDSITIDGRGGDDQIFIDSSNGAIAVPGGIEVIGGAGEADEIHIFMHSAATVISSSGLLTGTTAGSGSHEMEIIDGYGERGRQFAAWSGIESPAESITVAQDVDTLREGLQDFALALKELLTDALRDADMAGIDALSLAGALNGVLVDSVRPKDDPFVSVSQIGADGTVQIDNATSFLLRLFEENGFDLSEVAGGGAISSPDLLAQALRDTLGATVAFDDTLDRDADGLPDIFFEVQVLGKTLDGIVDLDIAADVLGGGRVELGGQIELSAVVDLDLSFGVGAKGFFIKPNAAGDSELTIRSITVDGEVSAIGRLGFIGIEAIGAALQLDPNVSIALKLSDPGEGGADGIIRMTEVDLESPLSLVSVSVIGDPGDETPTIITPGVDDMVLTGSFGLQAIVPGFDMTTDLLDLELSIAWPNLGVIDQIKVGAGEEFGAWLDFLDLTAQNIVDQLKSLRDQFTALAQVSNAFGLDVAFVKNALDEILDVADAVNRKLIDPLTSGVSGTASFPTAQELVVQLASKLGVDIQGFGVRYDNGELTFDVNVTHAIASFQEVLEFGFDMAEGIADLNVSADTSFSGDVTVDLTFGLDLADFADGVPIAETFFIKDASITGTAAFDASSFDASARFGFLEVAVEGGQIWTTTPISFKVDLLDPKTNADDGRIDLGELIDAVISPQEIKGSIKATLPLAVPFLGLSASPATTLMVEMLDIGDPGSLQADFGELNSLVDFRSISPGSVLAGLRALADMLRQLAGGGALGKSLPFIGSNLKEVITVADTLDSLLDTLEAFSTVEGLQAALENALGTPVQVQTTAVDVQFAFNLRDTFSKDLSFQLEETVAGAELELSGDLQASGSADLGIRFGMSFDGSLPDTERFYLLPGPGSMVELAFKMITENPIVAAAALGFITVGIQNGSATVAGRNWNGIDPASDAKAYLSFVDPGTGVANDGRITLKEILSNPLGVLGQPVFEGAVQVVLPITPPAVLTDVQDVTVQLDWSDLGDPGSLSITYDEAALSAYLIDPAALLDPEFLSAAAKAGLQKLGEWLDRLVADLLDTEPFTTELPLVEKSIAELLDLGEILPLAADAILAFSADPNATTQHFVDQVSTALLTLESSIAGLDVAVFSDRIFAGLLRAGDTEAAGWLGYTPDSDQLLFNVGFRADRTLADQILRLAADTNVLGVDFEVPVSANAALDFDFTFGYDLTEGLLAEDALFLRVNDFRVGFDVAALANFDLTMGFLSAAVENGSLDLSADFRIELANLGADPAGRLTLNDVLGSSPAGLISTEVLNSALNANLPLRAGIGELAAADATLIMSGDPLSGDLPELRVEGANFDDFTNFSQLTPLAFLAALEQIGAFLKQISGADFLDISIPVVDVTVGEALDLGQAFSAKVIDHLYVREGVPAFNNTEEFIAILAGLAGIDPDQLASDYDATTGVLTYRLKLTHDFLTIPADFSFDIDLGPFGGLESSSQLSVNALGELDLTIGFDLSAPNLVLTANRPLPLSGQWPGGEDWRLPEGQNARFDLVMDGNDPIPVQVSALATRNNLNSNDLVEDINSALQTALRAAGLNPNDVVAGLAYGSQGLYLTLTTSEGFEGGSLMLRALPDDPAVGVLGFGGSGQGRILVLRTSGLALPDDGILGDDAHFVMAINGNAPLPVTVAASDTSANLTRQDLIADINRSLSQAGLSKVSAGLTGGGRLMFTAGGAATALQITALPGDPAITELGLAESQSEGPYPEIQMASVSLLDQLLIDALSFHGELAVNGTLDAAASFGMVDIVIDGADANLTGAVDFDILDLGAPVRVMELFENLSNFGSYLAGSAPSLSGTANLNLPVSVEGALAQLFNLGVDAGLTVGASNIFQPDTWTADFQGLEGLADFGELDFDMILQALEKIVQYFRDISSQGVLGYELPLINVSVGDALDFAEKLAEAVQELRNHPAGTLQALDQKLEEALASVLGQAPGDLVNLVVPPGGQDFQIALNFSPNIPSYTLPLNFDLQSLGLFGTIGELPGIGNLLDVSGQGLINVDATAELNIDLGIDLSDPSNPRPYLGDTTGLLLGAKLSADNLDFDLAVGPLGVYIRDGFVTLGVGDTPAALDFATFTVGMKPAAGGKYYLLESFPGVNDIDINVTGEVHAALPVYYPTESTPLDPAVPNIELHIGSLADFFANPGAATQFTTPDFSNLFNTADLFVGLDGFFLGLDLILGTLQDALDSELFGKDLPLIGDNLKGAANFISKLREDIRGVQDILETSADQDQLKQKLVEVLGPKSIYGVRALEILKDTDEDGDYTDEIDVLVTPDPLPQGTLPDEVEFRMAIGGQYDFGDIPIGFDFGIPGLGFEVNDASHVEVALDWEFNFGFGVSRTDGFYFTTYDGSEDHTLDVQLGITIPGLQALGRIGFLAVLIEDDLQVPSHLSGGITVDILDPYGSNNRLTFNELTSVPDFSSMVDISLGLEALVNLDLTLGFAFDKSVDSSGPPPVYHYEPNSKYPTLTSDFVLSWDLGLGGGFEELSAPSVSFDNIRLQIGTFLSEFVGDILGPIQQILEPVQPIIDVLTAPLPGISYLFGSDTSILDLARLYDGGEAADFIEGAIGIINLVNSLEVGENIYLDFGSLSFGEGFDLRTQSLSGLDAASLPYGVSLAAPAEDVDAQLSGKAGEFDQAKDDVGSGFSIPILEDPSTAIGLLFGQDVLLFEYTMPTLGIEFEFRKKFGPFWDVLWVHVGGRLGAQADFTFGYDTKGLSVFIDNPGNPAVLIDGFYVSDRIDSKGQDPPEVTVWGELFGGGSVDLLLVEGGADVGVRATIGLNLRDRDDLGPPDGKIRLPEMAQNISEGGFT